MGDEEEEGPRPFGDPGPPGQTRRPSGERASPDGAKERQNNQPCFPFSCGHPCEGPKENPPHCYRQHRALTNEEKLKRDKIEEATLKAGKTLPCNRAPKQASAAAAANINAAAGETWAGTETERALQEFARDGSWRPSLLGASV